MGPHPRASHAAQAERGGGRVPGLPAVAERHADGVRGRDRGGGGHDGRRATSDREDMAGKPFVGPAGKLLDKALDEAAIDRRKVYVTNVVKHFKFRPRGKRRIHQKPNWSEMAACRPWLDAELAVVRPRVLVCLGATAAQALLGRDFRITRQRGEPIESPLAPHVVATVHPSSILRAGHDESRREQMDDFVADLRTVASLI